MGLPPVLGSARRVVNEVSVSQQLARRDRHFLHAGNNPERANAAQAPAPLGANLMADPFADSSVLPHWAATRMKSVGAVSGLGPLRVTCTVWRLLTTAVTVWVAAASSLHPLRSGAVYIL